MFRERLGGAWVLQGASFSALTSASRYPSGVRAESASAGTRHIARVKSYGDVLKECEFHEEAKCADAGSAPCDKQTAGLLRAARDDRVATTLHRQRVEQARRDRGGSVPDAGDVYTEYLDPRRDEWVMRILPVLRGASVSAIINAEGMSPRALQRVRAGRFCRILREVKTLKSYRSARPRIV